MTADLHGGQHLGHALAEHRTQCRAGEDGQQERSDNGDQAPQFESIWIPNDLFLIHSIYRFDSFVLRSLFILKGLDL